MAEPLVIPVSNLLIDSENPRLSKPNVGQREAMRELAEDQQTKVLKLAEHIVQHGPNLSELPIVMPADNRSFTVLEGNRRLTALRGLENPDSLAGALFPAVLAGFRKLSAVYQQNPVEDLMCLVVKDRDEARPWIELRHTGENEGAGIVRWNADESGRYRARTRKLEPHLRALEFLEERGVLTSEQRKKVPTASLRRLLSTPAVRQRLGLDFQDGTLMLTASEGKAAKALMFVVNDLLTGQVKTEQIYTKELREKYANSLPTNIAVREKGKPPPVTPVVQPGKPSPAPKTKPHKDRDKLIPRDCPLNITDNRVSAIERELRALSLDAYTNAVSVLFRVFIELSCDDYITRNALSTTLNASLSKKIQDVAADLVARKKLTKEQATAARQFSVKNSFFAPSVTQMNGYLHNQFIFPAPRDLRAYWDSLQPFNIAVWMP